MARLPRRRINKHDHLQYDRDGLGSNAIVFNVHPNARSCSMTNVRLIHGRLPGLDCNLVTTVRNRPSNRPGADDPQRRSAAYRHGRRRGDAPGDGERQACDLRDSGNPPVVVDETADLEHAARSIVAGASFDNNIVCTDEGSRAVGNIVDEYQRMGNNGAYVLSESELHKVMNTIFTSSRNSVSGGRYRKT